MASDKKRKSGDAVAPAAKKAKTAAPAKSAERPAPLKSALKKTKVETEVVDKPMEKKSKTVTEVVEKPKEKKSKTVTEVVEKPKEKKSKTSKKVPVEEPVPEVEDEDEAEGGAELTADQTAALLAGFSSDEEEDAEAQEEGIEISKLPAPPKPTKSSSKQDDDSESTPGVIYISRLPHGFFEPQLRAYFSQFGSLTHLRLARNRKTGKGKHYAFLEFAAASVADIVAKTMDKYLLFGHILQVKRVPAEQVKEGMWKGPRGKVAPRNRLEGARLRKGVDREAWSKRITREEERRQEKAKKLQEMGYEFDMPAVKGVDAVPVKEIEEPEGVQLIEGKKEEVVPGVEEKIETVVEDGKITVEKTKKVKRKSTDAVDAPSKTLTKKRKTKAAA